jgi:hypothetical protein
VAAAIPTTEPPALVAGDTLKFQISLADYSASDGWTLEYSLQNAASIETFNSSASGDDHLVTVAASATANWPPGAYRFAARAVNGSEKYTVRQGSIEITANLDAAADQRSHAETVLDAIEAMLEGKATKDQQSYSIAGRSITRLTPEELLSWRDTYRKEVQRQRRQEARDRGEPATGNFVRTRFQS